MNAQRLDIVNLINNSPVTSLSNEYQTKLLHKIQKTFTNDQQQLFIASFYTYLNYNSKTDFVIDLDNIWKWLGFSRKEHCKTLLVKHFTNDIDYKCLLPQLREQNNELKESRGGHNKEQIMLNIETFKGLCMLAGTVKSKEIRQYYLKLEELLQETMKEESEALRLQLEQQKELSELEKEILLENTLLSQFPPNTQCVYYGKIDNKDLVGGSLVKFGNSTNLQERVKVHKKTYTNFRLTNAFKVTNQIEIENCIKRHPILKQRIRNIMIKDMNYRELICIDKTNKDSEFSLEKLDEYIKDIIDENQYNIENYKKLIEKNNNLEKELRQTQETNKKLQETNDKLQKEIDKFKPSIEETLFKKHNKSETTSGYSLFVFNCNESNNELSRYKIGLCKTSTVELREKAYKTTYKNGNVQYSIQLKHPFLEKVLLYLLKRHLTCLNTDLYDGSFNDVKLILNIVYKLEDMIINNDLDNIIKIINNEKIEIVLNDPEIPFVKKAKRSIDQIDKDTGKIITTFPSIEAAGRSLGLTTGTAIGVALRNKSICQGFAWRYSGISKEDQMLDQPVIRIKCSTGEKKEYPNIASAAKEAKISPPGLRNRILTDVHSNGYHWIFNKIATHYTT